MTIIVETIRSEIKSLAESIKITFDTPDSIRQQIKKLTNTQKRLYQIKDEINSEARNLGFVNIFHQVREFGSRGLSLARGVGEAALGIKLKIANIAIPFASDVGDIFGSSVLVMLKTSANKFETLVG